MTVETGSDINQQIAAFLFSEDHKIFFDNIAHFAGAENPVAMTVNNLIVSLRKFREAPEATKSKPRAEIEKNLNALQEIQVEKIAENLSFADLDDAKEFLKELIELASKCVDQSKEIGR